MKNKLKHGSKKMRTVVRFYLFLFCDVRTCSTPPVQCTVWGYCKNALYIIQIKEPKCLHLLKLLFTEEGKKNKKHCQLAFYSTRHQQQFGWVWVWVSGGRCGRGLFLGTRPPSGRTYFSLPFDPFDWRNAQLAGWMGEWDKQTEKSDTLPQP